MDNEEIESILYIAREISVYRIPPLSKNEGHRANDWGNLAEPLWKGRMRIVEKGTDPANILFEDASTGELFAKAAYDPTKPSVEAVLDSSRYFVVRVEDSGKKAYIGMGFAERTDSFDFNVALQDYTKRYKARLNPPSPTETDKPSPHVPTGPKKDYSLKEGQTFSISIPGREKKTDSLSTSGLLGGTTDLLGGTSTAGGVGAKGGSSGGAFPLLPPPPSAPRRR
ncbi:adaptin ear-binding coat-associated protein 1 NECAP-1 [Stereum hirsutum FP-91666 SS1]|uniref:adaptin ear-binding coat-associated protein 1 NECAP-1 n=1 Tax=Stereum hirsutum (strain FP-91666) TaxID=721885 RepID=UPI00044103B4|nr:adaptin ear-binding coat-associated protein 1 NECAP-1 [Stereum hirsutum FP-91666 SS1]EIM89777.1 adaptin ear-binding coat-associated protein 1 NECAP-1 [Stereum hirsutum FP-91666 SS1]